MAASIRKEGSFLFARLSVFLLKKASWCQSSSLPSFPPFSNPHLPSNHIFAKGMKGL
jgi:hypothetical protein